MMAGCVLNAFRERSAIGTCDFKLYHEGTYHDKEYQCILFLDNIGIYDLELYSTV